MEVKTHPSDLNISLLNISPTVAVIRIKCIASSLIVRLWLLERANRKWDAQFEMPFEPVLAVKKVAEEIRKSEISPFDYNHDIIGSDCEITPNVGKFQVIQH